jgi:hypothetical protein
MSANNHSQEIDHFDRFRGDLKSGVEAYVSSKPSSGPELRRDYSTLFETIGSGQNTLSELDCKADLIALLDSDIDFLSDDVMALEFLVVNHVDPIIRGLVLMVLLRKPLPLTSSAIRAFQESYEPGILQTAFEVIALIRRGYSDIQDCHAILDRISKKPSGEKT